MIMPSNPFATRFTRPGAIAYQFSPHDSLEACGRQLAALSRAQIVGPHGCGKSTLMRSLIRWWALHVGPATLWRIGPDGRRADHVVVASDLQDVHRLVCIDGWDSLCALQRRLWAWLPRADCILVTTHAAIPRWPTLRNCESSLPRFQRVVDQLQQSLPPEQRIDRETIRGCHTQQPNAREALFALYDIIEQRRPRGEHASCQ